MTNPPHYALASYTFYKSKYQVKDLLDSLISTKNNFFWQEGRSYREMILNMKSNGDTVSYILKFGRSDLEWVSQPDSVELLLAAVSEYRDWKSDIVTINPAFDSVVKKKYKKIFDSTIIKPLTLITGNAEAYSFYDLTVDEKLPAKWVICKNKKKTNCDTVFIDSYIKDSFLLEYQIIPKDSL